MEQQHISDGLEQFNFWKQHITGTLDNFQEWLEANDLFTEEAWNAFARCLDKIESDKITIAFVGEFSRGKTELINSLFFSDTGRRLLPSSAGRTTMCPTEILYDEEAETPYIRLLPIETRLRDESLAQLRKSDEEWIELPLEMENEELVENSLQELSSTRKVTPEEALRYGLLTEEISHGKKKPKHVEIPKWRHAIISYPHPLLKKGLVILDTPGLNAIGSEPELTLNMLPAAQAALFVLAADTGVTQSDLEMWQKHLQGHHKTRRKGLTVVLNKIDTLWDDLRDEQYIEDSIRSQMLYTARILTLPLQQVFPVSAQKGLLSLVKKDQDLLEKSGINELEKHLNEDVLEAKQQIIMDDINSEVIEIIQGLRGLLGNRLTQNKNQLQELSDLQNKSGDAIEQLLEKTQQEQTRYRNNAKAFNASHSALNEKARELQQVLDPKKFEQIVRQTNRQMQKSLTTVGIKKSISEFTHELNTMIEQASESIGENRKMIRSIYNRFQKDHGIGVIQPKMFSLMSFQAEFDKLIQETEHFKASPRMAMSGQAYIIKNFFSTIGIKAKKLINKLRRDLSHWLNASLQPLAFQIQDHRDILNRQIQDLKLATQSRDTLHERIQQLKEEKTQQKEQLIALRNFSHGLTQLPERKAAKPYLVKSDSRQQA